MQQKKVLIIAYYWPPAGGPGVQRWLKFCKYLPDFAIQPVVYVPKNPSYPILDESLAAPKDTIVLKNTIFEPLKIAQLFSSKKSKTLSAGIINQQQKQSILERLMLYIRGNYFIPDARKYWVKPSISYLKKYLEKEQIDTIITTGPPHSLHLIGLGLKNHFPDINWIADFRDPWTSISYHKKLKITSKSQAKHKKLEQKVLTTADKIIVTSPSTKREFEQITTKEIKVITNGYDDMPQITVRLDNKFTLAHIGSLLADRNPKVLWEVLAELVTENKDFASDFQLKLAGKISDTVLESIVKAGLKDYTSQLGYLPHNEIITLQKNSQILLLITINSKETEGIIPGKLFEYMVSGRPIVALGPENADYKTIIKQTNTGTCFDYTDKIALKKQLLLYYSLFKENKLKTQPLGLQKYHRKALTNELSKIILSN